MAKYSQIQEERLRMVIRDAMALNPLITLRSLQTVIEKKINRGISQDYIIKLQRKARGEIKIRPEIESYEKRVSELREKNRIIIDELFRMAFPDPNLPAHEQPSVIDRRKALESVARIERDMIKLEMDLGLFTRHLGEVDINHRHSVAFDEKALETIVQTFQAWATPPQMRRIEPQRMIEAKATVITNEPPKSTAKPISAPIPAITGAGLVRTE